MLWAVPGSFCFALFSSHTIAFSFADSHFSSLSRTSLSQLYFRYISHHFSICFSSTTFFSTLTLHDLDSILHILLLYYTSVAQQHLENSVADKVSIIRIPHGPTLPHRPSLRVRTRCSKTFKRLYSRGRTCSEF